MLPQFNAEYFFIELGFPIDSIPTGSFSEAENFQHFGKDNWVRS